MQQQQMAASERYAKAVEVSKRIRWDIERDVIRGRKFDVTKKYLPDGLSMAPALDFLGKDEKRLLSQIQGRTYANIFGLVERFITAKQRRVVPASRASNAVVTRLDTCSTDGAGLWIDERKRGVEGVAGQV